MQGAESTDLPGPDSGRKHLTVLFCDLVDSAGLSQRLDMEDFRDLLASCHRVCADAVGLHGGHVSQFLGDGVLCYFGYPAVREDDAVRAVGAALKILEGIRLVNEGIGRRLGSTVQMRLGLHSGVAVLSQVGEAHDHVAIGETVNLAARLQSVAEPNTAVVSDATAKLVAGYFELAAVGSQVLKGYARPVSIHRVVRATGAQNHLQAAARQGLTPLVGREGQSAALGAIWRQVCAGADKVVIVRGEAGIGKSRLVHHLRHDVVSSSSRALECFCSPMAQATPLAPIAEMLHARLNERARRDAEEAKLEALAQMLGEHSHMAADAAPLLAALLGLPVVDDAPVAALSPVRRRIRTLELLRDWASSSAERTPLAIVIEDVHWADPSTLDFLDLIVRRPPGGRTLFCLTCRPEFAVPWSSQRVEVIDLPRLGREEVYAIASHVAGGPWLPQRAAKIIEDRSEGVPLFIEEVTKALLESGAVHTEPDRPEAAPVVNERLVPATVQASLFARFDLLGDGRRVAQLGAAIGREFPYRLLQVIAGGAEELVGASLERLCRSELAHVRGRAPDATYVFKHALIQDAIYETLPLSERRLVHDRILAVLRDQFPDLVDARPEISAHHAERAGLHTEAVNLFREAGLRAFERTATAEAVKHLGRAIDLVVAFEEPARSDVEMTLQAAIVPAYMATLGWAAAEVERACSRLRELAAARGAVQAVFVASVGLTTVAFLRGRLDVSLERARGCRDLAASTGDRWLQMIGTSAVGHTHFYRGEYEEAIRRNDEAFALLDLAREKANVAVFQISFATVMASYRAQAKYLVGATDAAWQSLREGRALVADLHHAPTRANWLCQECRFFHAMDDVAEVKRAAAETRALSVAEGFEMWIPIADAFLAWASCRSGGDADEAVGGIRHALATLHGLSLDLGLLEFTALLVEAHVRAGRPAEVFELARSALEVAHAGEQRDYEPELHRLQGDAAQAMRDGEGARGHYARAAAVARAMGAVAQEARANAALAALAPSPPQTSRSTQ